jgi:hypothetical protein
VPTAPSAPTSASGLRNKQHKKRILKSVLLFYAIACGFAWLAWMPLVFGPAGLKLHKYPISLPVSVCIGTLGRFLDASSPIVCKLAIGEPFDCYLEVVCR